MIYLKIFVFVAMVLALLCGVYFNINEERSTPTCFSGEDEL